MKPKNANIEFYLGIDISKNDFHVALLRASDHKVTVQKTFANNTKGYQALYDWLLKNTSPDLSVHLCLRPQEAMVMVSPSFSKQRQ